MRWLDCAATFGALTFHVGTLRRLGPTLSVRHDMPAKVVSVEARMVPRRTRVYPPLKPHQAATMAVANQIQNTTAKRVVSGNVSVKRKHVRRPLDHKRSERERLLHHNLLRSTADKRRLVVNHVNGDQR